MDTKLMYVLQRDVTCKIIAPIYRDAEIYTSAQITRKVLVTPPTFRLINFSSSRACTCCFRKPIEKGFELNFTILRLPWIFLLDVP